MTIGLTIAKRLVLTAVVAVMVIGLATVGALLVPSNSGVDEGPAHPEYDADRLAPDRLESSGQANPQGDVGVVLFDRSHGNRFGEEDISPLVQAIDRAGGEVQFTDVTDGFLPALEEADVLVVVDPASQYTNSEVDAVQQFVDDGGRVVIVGEPNRKIVEQQGLQVGLGTRRARLTSVSSAFGISFGSQYLYDMENNDGNFKSVVVSPPDGADAGAVEGVEQVALYTATAVETDRGTVLLRTARSAERGNDASDQRYPVAVLAGGGGVVAVGDKTFLSQDYSAIADNDVFVQRLVEFMATADHQPSTSSARSEERPDSNSTRSVR